jgi:erythromycin esterase
MRVAGTFLAAFTLLLAGTASPASNNVTCVNAASYQGTFVAPGSIVAGFGANLASQSASASPPAEVVAGTSIQITDSAGIARNALIFAVSPAQVNFLLPDDTAAGAATMTVSSTQGQIAAGTIQVKPASPGIFSANANGQGVASALAIQVTPQNAQTSTPVFRYDANQKTYLPVAIEIGNIANRVFLSLYGTGFRHGSSFAVTIAGKNAPLQFAGPNPQYPGVDQVNVEIPKSLLGRDGVDVIVSADGMQANTVQIELLQPSYLNLDFESSENGNILGWGTGGAGYEVVVDTSVMQSGNQSLRIRNLSPATTVTFGVASSLFPIEAVRGHRIRYSGWIKTDRIQRGYAGLWWRVDGPSGTVLGFNNMQGSGPSGTTDWRSYAFELDVSPDAVDVVFGVLQTGDGTAWFDNLSVTIDGSPYLEASPPLTQPTAAQLNWVRQSSILFSTPDPGNGFADLEPLKAVVGNAHLIGLGEDTHGTSEFFRMKHRLLEFLATEMGVTVFAIEANMPEAYAVNNYVLTGQGDPAQLLKGMYFWTWNTQEVLDMILWMRQYNASGKGPLQFTGFDMQYSQVAIPNVTAFVTKADPGYLPALNAAYAKAAAANYNSPTATVQDATNAAHAVWQYLDGHRTAYLGTGLPASDVEWAIQNAKIVEQAVYDIIAPSSRDAAMAANMDWILKQQQPGTRAVAWAHNGHINREPRSMGGFLSQTHGDDYRPLGFLFHSGQYNAYRQEANTLVLGPNTAIPSFPGTVEWVFHSAGMPRFILDLRQASYDDPASSWLLGEVIYRSIGALAVDGYYLSNRLVQDFDGIIYFEQTNPSHLLPF